MLTSLQGLLALPGFEDERTARAAWLLNRVLLVLLVMSTPAVIYTLLQGVSGLEQTVLPLAGIGFNLLCLRLLRLRRVRLASGLFIGAAWLIVIMASMANRGVHSPTYTGCVVLILLALLLFDERAAVGVTLLTLAAGGALVLLERQGIVPLSNIPALSLEMSFFWYVVFFATAAVLMYNTARYLTTLFENLRHSEQELSERNRELERQISERQRAETELARFFELSLDLFTVASFEGYFTRVNPAFERVLGWSREELLSTPIISLVHPDDAARTSEASRQLEQGGLVFEFENRVRCKDGSYRWLSWNSQSYDGVIYAAARDVTERKTAEDMLRASEERYRLLFENTGVSTLLYDYDGTILMANQLAADAMEYDLDSIIGRNIRDLVPPDLAETFIRENRMAIDSNQQMIVSSAVTLRDGSQREYVVNIHPLKDFSGKPYAVQVVAQDVTALKQAEKQQFELALAKQKAEFLSDFLDTFSHDLKTPLTVMNTSLYLLEHTADEARRQEKIHQIQAQMRRIEKLVQDTLVISRLEHLPQLDRELVNVHQLLLDVAQQLRPRAEQKRQQLRVKLGVEGCVVSADADQLQRAFVNLAENAVNYTPEGGSIDLHTCCVDGFICVEVHDTGIGIAPADLPHIFERFYRSEEARTLEQGGTGLGLAIVKKILDMHHYEVQVSSTPGEGTTFRVRMTPTTSI